MGSRLWNWRPILLQGRESFLALPHLVVETQSGGRALADLVAILVSRILDERSTVANCCDLQFLSFHVLRCNCSLL